MAGNMFKIFFAIQKSNLKQIFQTKADSLVNMSMMLLNNCTYIFMWWIVFNNRGSINGWTFQDMAFLFAILNTSYGIYALSCCGIQLLPQMVEQGSLDHIITSPQPPLFLIATSYASFANWGDILTGIIMFAMSGYCSLYGFCIYILCSLTAFSLIFSVSLAAHSLSFFANNMERLAHNIFLAFITFSSQPAAIFQGLYKIIFLTLLPAGFLSLFPVRLAHSFSWADFTVLIAGCLIFLLASRKIFYIGLSHYESNNMFSGH